MSIVKTVMLFDTRTYWSNFYVNKILFFYVIYYTTVKQHK